MGSRGHLGPQGSLALWYRRSWGEREVTTSPVCAGKAPDSIDTWPGQRSSCMIVISTILASLASLLLLAFLVASTVRL
jgi:hypothetical protein